MKKSIFALFLLVSSSAFASLPQPHVTIAAVNNVSDEIVRVEADNYGVVTVVPRHSRHLVIKQASDFSRDQIFYAAQSLANAEIETKHHVIVCMMALGRYLPMLQVSTQEQGSLFTGELRDTLSEHNCAMSVTIGPKDQFLFNQAEQLKKLLIVLGHEYLAE